MIDSAKSPGYWYPIVTGRAWTIGVSNVFQTNPTTEATLSYFFGCATVGKAVAVDVVAGDEVRFIEEAKTARVSITYVIDTHVHADHYSGGRKLAQAVGAPYRLHESNRGNVRFGFLPLTDGRQRLQRGPFRQAILHHGF